MKSRWSRGCLVAMLWVAGCGGGGGSSDATDNTDVLEDPTDAVTGDSQTPNLDENYRVAYWYEGRLSGTNVGQGHLFLADPRDTDSSNDIELSTGLTALGLDCHLGCFVDRDLKWMAVARGSGDTGDFTLKLLAIGADRSLAELPFAEVDQVAHIEFVGNAVYYSRKLDACSTTTDTSVSCYGIHRVQLDAPGAAAELVFSFPPDDAQDGARYQGHFETGEDGQTLLLVLPFHRSKRIYMYRDQTLSAVGSDLCTGHDTEGNCASGTSGAVYSDSDPVALSKDGNTLVFTAIEDDQELRLFVHDITTGVRRHSVIMKVGSNYVINACVNRESWQYTEILSPIRFSADGSSIVLLGAADCGEANDKVWTNLFRIPLSIIGSGQLLARTDYQNITDFPAGKTSAAVSIATFDLSPSGDNVVFLGTPQFQEDGSSIPNASPRHFTDSEVYVTSIDGSAVPRQVTNSASWKASDMAVIRQTP